MLPYIGCGLLRIPGESHLLIVAVGRVSRLTKQDQPRRPRKLGKATAIHGVGCSAWLGYCFLL